VRRREVDLHKRPTITDPVYQSTESYQDLLAKQVDQLSALQQLLYASNRYSILLIFLWIGPQRDPAHDHRNH
jgi:hypothetical protein